MAKKRYMACSRSRTSRTARGAIGALIGGVIVAGGELIYSATTAAPASPTHWPLALSFLGGAAAGGVVGAWKPDC